jgi:hypothetical protein
MARSPKTSQQQRRTDWEADFRRGKAVARSRSGGRCEFDDGERCTKPAYPTHHRLPHVHPRANDPEFLLDLCTPHHTWVHANSGISFAMGWRLRFTDVPKEVAA